MRASNLLSRLPTFRQVTLGLRLALLLVLAALGTVLIVERPGLEGEYFALDAPWEGEPYNSVVGEPRLGSASEAGEALKTKVVFSVRWTGWWEVKQGGEHGFSLDVDDGGYLRVDDELLVDTDGLLGDPIEGGRKILEPGFHPVEIGLYQTYGDSRLTVHWVAPGATLESARALPLADLYAGRPLALRAAARRTLGDWPRAYVQVLGSALLLVAILLLPGLAARCESLVGWIRERLEALDGRGLRAALLLGLFALAFFGSLPYTGSLRGGDDTAYLHAATFSAKSWFFNRYVHVYLLKLFTGLSGGDPLVGVRVWWSFAFAATVAALALAVRSIGPGLQLRTLAATLFVLFSQTTLMGLIGTGFADYSAMMFITVAVALYLHGLDFAQERPPPRHEWHALAIGALTVCAFRSKEVGAVLLVLPMLHLIGSGRPDLRRFARRMAYWAAGAAAVLGALVLLDGWILGEFLFTWDGGRLERSESMNFPSQLAPREATDNWLQTIWNPRQHAANLALRYVWLGVAAAALVAGLRRKRLEVRLLHLLPIAYLVAIIALYVRMPHPFSPRMLVPILPVACLMTGLLLHHAGLDDVPWREIFRPSLLIPGGLAAAAMVFVVVPYRLGELEAASLLPVDLVRRFGWEPEAFIFGVVLPVLFLAAVSGVAVIVSRSRGWVTALVIAYLALFGAGFELTRASLAKSSAEQTGELLVYPWKTFRDELDADPDMRIVALSRDLQWYFHMSETTRTAIGRLALGRRDFKVVSLAEVPLKADVAIASRYTYEAWLRNEPALAATAVFDPNGFLVLMRPKEAVKLAAGATPPTLAKAGLTPKTIEARLEGLRVLRDPGARNDLLQEILDTLQGPRRHNPLGVRYLDGYQLRAVSLTDDGWTDGTKPAGLIVKNFEATPSVQEIRLAVHAPEVEYPIQVSVDDGEDLRTVRFDGRGSRKLALRPIPPGSARLVLVWSDKAWAPSARTDERKLGVRILPPVEE